MSSLSRKLLKELFPLKLLTILYASIFVALIIGGVLAGVQQNWNSVGLAVASVILFVVPLVAKEKLKVYIPTAFSLLIGSFLYATIILGQLENYYKKYWWWDIMLHSGSGVAFGLVGLVAILIFFRQGRISAKPFVLCLFAFCFSLSVGLLWEVFEFSGDMLVHTNMQQTQTGVVDTMKDEIMDTIGALIGSTLGYFYLKSGTSTPIDAILNKTVRKNRKKS